MIIRLCDVCQKQTHSAVEIAFKDATVYFQDPEDEDGGYTKGRVRERKARGDIKRRVWEIDLCVDHWPLEGVYPPEIPGKPLEVQIFWNPDKLSIENQAEDKPSSN